MLPSTGLKEPYAFPSYKCEITKLLYYIQVLLPDLLLNKNIILNKHYFQRASLWRTFLYTDVMLKAFLLRRHLL